MTFIDPLKCENHRGTETQRGHRASRPHRNHEGTKTRRKHKARSIIRRGPGSRAARGRWERVQPRTQASGSAPTPSGPRSRRAQASPLALIKDPRSSRYECGETDAPCASAGVKTVWDERSRSEQAGFAPGGGDHRIAGVSAVPLRAASLKQVPLLCGLRVFVVATALASVPSVPLWFGRCDGSA